MTSAVEGSRLNDVAHNGTVSQLPLRSFYQAAFPKLFNLRENEISDWPCNENKHFTLDKRNASAGSALWMKNVKIPSSDFHIPYPCFDSLTHNGPYRGRTAPLTSKRCILYIYSTYIGTEYFKYGIYSSFFSFKMQFVS